MISILIPVYDFDVTSLVNGLHSVIINSEVYCEIIIGADGCSDKYIDDYKMLTELEKVHLHIEHKNVGRAAIRNKLADKSCGAHLLYLDADALIVSSAKVFLGTYIQYLNSAPVICGGVKYRDTAPDDPDKFLRWRYGHKREQKNAKTRNKDAYASFSGFNFLVQKELLHKIRFNEELRMYGHEDTLFGYQLRIAKVPILHIDNALIHDGLEPNRIFIQKTQEGISNLSLLYDQVTNRKLFTSMVRLLRLYKYLKYFGIDRIINRFFISKRRRFEIMLRSHKTSVRTFDFYKLALLCHHRINPDKPE
ncbi:MAG: glycosyltransferase [Bacteroidales bacterium]|nr:glycosyltransferase [Bacteroidales bacterium]